MRLYDLPSGDTVDLDQVIQVGPLFVNKNDANYNCYEIYLTNGTSYGILDVDLSRSAFIVSWEGV